MKIIVLEKLGNAGMDAKIHGLNELVKDKEKTSYNSFIYLLNLNKND